MSNSNNNDKELEKGIETVLGGLASSFETESIDNFKTNFPTLCSDLEKYAEDRVSEKQFYVNYYRMELNNGSMQLYNFANWNNEDKKYSWAICGVLDGTLEECLDGLIRFNPSIRSGYADVVGKLMVGTIQHLQTKENQNLYEEYNEDDIKEIEKRILKDNEKYKQRFEENYVPKHHFDFDSEYQDENYWKEYWKSCIIENPKEYIEKNYLGQPKNCSTTLLKTSQDVIDWYYNVQMLYKKMIKLEPSKLNEIVKEELEDK